jgi:drug/metabolite transporter (DMT)-like permease
MVRKQMLKRLQAIFILLIPFLFVFLWSTGFIAAKYALPYIAPFYLLFIRMSLTVVTFVLLCLLFKARWLSISQIGHQMITGALVHGAYLGGVFAAIKWGMPAGITAIVVGTQPVLTAVLGKLWLKEQLRPRQWLGLGLGLAGVTTVLLSANQQGAFDLSWPAVLAAISALIGISVGTLYQKRFGQNVNLLAGSLFQYISAAGLMALLAGLFESSTVIWDRQLILALTWLIIGLSVTAILLLMYMIREGETSRVASYFYLVPPVASIEAWILFDETLSLLSICAIAVTVLGVILVTKRR